MTGGVYAAVFVLAVPRRIRIGRLGRFAFPAGRYVYVGSAQRGLIARLARHARRRKPMRWHVDYLSRWARLETAWAWPRPKRDECRLASALAAVTGAAPGPSGFGASDCRCRTHLYRQDAVSEADLPAALGPRWADAVVYDAVRLRRPPGMAENG
jgi:sugar fermentation stimulation protein A